MRPRLRPRGAGASSARRPRALCLCRSGARRPEARPGRVLPVENVLLEDAVPLPRARPGPASSRPSAWPAALPREAGPPGRPRQRQLREDTRLPTAGSRPPTGCRPATPTAPRTRTADGRASGADAQHVRRVEPAPPSPAVQADPVLSRLPAQAVPDQRLHTWLCKTPDPEANATATGAGRRLPSPSSVKRRPRRRPRCCGLAVQRAWGRPGSRCSVSLRGRPRGKGAWLSSPDTPASPPRRGGGRNPKRHVPLLLLLV